MSSAAVKTETEATHRPYDKAFKRAAVAQWQSSVPARRVAEGLGITTEGLRTWRRQAEHENPCSQRERAPDARSRFERRPRGQRVGGAGLLSNVLAYEEIEAVGGDRAYDKPLSTRFAFLATSLPVGFRGRLRNFRNFRFS